MPLFHRRPLARCIALSSLCAALLAPPAWAVGLGEVTLLSPLGKPLQAQIPLTHLGDLSSDQIKVTLGSDDDYARLGVDRDYLHSQIRLQPVVEGGRAYVRLSTSQPITEPYLNLVVSLRWPTGQLAREYTMLLDIPELAAPAPATTAAAMPSGNISAAAAEADAAAPARTAPVSRAAARSTLPPPASMPLDGRYRTESGDSLWRLAQRLRPAGVSVEQMMAALFAANPNAFLNGDPSQLMAAVELKVPDAAQANAAGALPSRESSSAAAPLPSEPADRLAGTQASAPTGASSDTVPVETSTETPAEASGARLELLAPTDFEQLSAENAALREEVRSLTSNIGALTGQLDSSEQRLQQLETKLQQVLAGYDRQRGADGAVTDGASPFADGSAQPVADAAADSAGIAAAQPAPERESSLWMHISYWVALGAVGGWALYQRSRGRREEEVETELEPIGALQPAATPHPSSVARVVARNDGRGAERERPEVPSANLSAETAPAVEPAQPWGSAQDNERYWQHHVDDGAELPLDLVDAEPVASPFASAGGGGAGIEDSVDASISAGVFLAFGRYSEAEQVLQEALQRDPSRQDLRLQLLDVYQQGDMREAFEQLAKAIEVECADQPGVVAEVAALRDSYSGRF